MTSSTRTIVKISGLIVVLLAVFQLISFQSFMKKNFIYEKSIKSQLNFESKSINKAASPFDTVPRVVILAGPHKTGSTTIQVFLASKAGLTVSLLPKKNAKTRKLDPKIEMTNWIWPIGVEGEYDGKNSPLAAGYRNMGDSKFYAPLMYVIGGIYIEKRLDPTKVYNYFRLFFRKPWQQGKNIVFGSETTSTLVWNLEDKTAGTVGEAMHIAPESSERIDRLLDLLPWDNNTSNSSNFNNIESSSLQPSSLRLQDIEVVIAYRTPRISHLESIWHQVGRGATLREWLLGECEFFATNSMALALQFARKGIKTTIVHMQGALEREGFVAAIACDVLKMGDSANNSTSSDSEDERVCDNEGKLHVPFEKQNVRKDKAPKDMDEKELNEINSALEEYDCGVWFHLQKYQEKGNLRMLHPSKDLFTTCKNYSRVDNEFSFKDLVTRIRSIARQDPNNNSSVSALIT